MKNRAIQNIFRGTIIVIGLLISVPSFAVTTDTAARPNVTLIATVNNGPALSPVRWSVFRVDNGSSTTPFRTFDHRHSLAIALPPGRYRAEASMNNISRSRVFDVSNRTDNSIIVALDATN